MSPLLINYVVVSSPAIRRIGGPVINHGYTSSSGGSSVLDSDGNIFAAADTVLNSAGTPFTVSSLVLNAASSSFAVI